MEIISGGLPSEVVDDIVKSDYPNLEKLILYVGVQDYGFDGSLDVFRPLLSKEKFPRLTCLGLVNAEEEDQVVEMLLSCDLLPQLKVLDISAGVLTDKGAQLLLDNREKIAHLELINMRYNYLTKEMCKRLHEELPMKVDTSDRQDAEEYDGEVYYFPLITE